MFDANRNRLMTSSTWKSPSVGGSIRGSKCFNVVLGPQFFDEPEPSLCPMIHFRFILISIEARKTEAI